MASSRLMDQARDSLRLHHYSLRTEQSYLHWIKRYILFNNKRHPADLGAEEISRFLTFLAVEKHVAAATQNQALSAILFLYKKVLNMDPGWVDDVVRAKRPKRLPTVLSKTDVIRLLDQLNGSRKLQAYLIYGSGLRLMEASRLRVKDLDLESGKLIIPVVKATKIA